MIDCTDRKQEIVESNKKDGTRAKRSTEKKKCGRAAGLCIQAATPKISAKPAQKAKVAWRSPTKNAVTSSIFSLKSGHFHFLLLGCQRVLAMAVAVRSTTVTLSSLALTSRFESNCNVPPRLDRLRACARHQYAAYSQSIETPTATICNNLGPSH